MKKINIFFFLLGLTLYSCETQENDVSKFESNTVTVANNTVTVLPYEYYRPIRNPMMGLREFFAPGRDVKRAEYPYPYGTLIREYMQWNKMENVASDGVDKMIAYSNHRWKGIEDINMKVVPRVFIVWMEPEHAGDYYINDPNIPDDIFGEHWASDMPPQTKPADLTQAITGGYFTPEFPNRVKAFVEKLGKAWDNDPRVAFVEMAIIGEWGEHHDPDISTYWPPHDHPELGHIANRTWIPGIEKVLGDAFTENFKNKKVVVRYAYDFKDYEFGIEWDVWGVPEEQERGYNQMKKLGDRWKTQVFEGEFGFIGSFLKYKNVDELVADKEMMKHVVETLRNLHCSFLGGITWSNFSDPVNAINYDLVQSNIGYRYLISEFKYPTKIETDKSFNISFQVKNTGAAPMYYNWPVEIALLKADTKEKVWGKTLNDVDIRNWLPGEDWDEVKMKYLKEPDTYTINENLTLDAVIPEGKYIISIAVLDPAGMLPSLRFATINYFEGGRHPMGYVGVDKEIDEYEINAEEFFNLGMDKTLKYKLN